MSKHHCMRGLNYESSLVLWRLCSYRHIGASRDPFTYPGMGRRIHLVQCQSESRYKGNACYTLSERVSHVQQTCLRICAHVFHTRSQCIYGFVPTRFTRKTNAFAVFSHAFHTRRTHSYLYALKLARARMHLSRRCVHLC